MKGFLKNCENYVSLSPKITTVGREGCDVTIQSPTVDPQHAVIEYTEPDDTFVLKDLNTTQGTYINDVRVQNAAVRLAIGDVIRFGYPGVPYEFGVENSIQQQASAQAQRRSAWSQPLTTQRDQPIYTQQLANNNLPCLSGPALSCTLWSQPLQQQSIPTIPRAPVFNRPVSAGANRKSSFERMQPISKENGNHHLNGAMNGMNGFPQQRGIIQNGTQPPPTPPSSIQGRPPSGGSQTYRKGDTNGYTLLQEKELKISQLSEEVKRLKITEYESTSKDRVIENLQHNSAEKDGVIEQLQQEIYGLQSQTHPVMIGGDEAITEKLMMLENTVMVKDGEIVALQEQLSHVVSAPHEDAESLRSELSERSGEVSNLRTDLDRVSKDKNMMSGLVTQLQRDLSNKDTSISRLSREIEKLKSDVREKDIEIATMVSKLSKKDPDKTEEHNAREKELISLRHKFKSAENKVSERDEAIQSLKGEITTMKSQRMEARQEVLDLKQDREGVKRQLDDVQKAERVVRTDLEQTSNRLFRFRNRVIQITYSVPGVETPTEELSDDDIIVSLKSTVSIATEAKRKIEDLQNALAAAEAKLGVFSAKSDTLKLHMLESMDRLKEKGRLSSNIKQEIELLQFEDLDPSLVWVRDTFCRSLTDSLEWEGLIDGALETCGVNTSLTNEGPADHIHQLHTKWEETFRERDRLREELDMAKQQHCAEIAQMSSANKHEVEALIKEAVERAKLEGEQAMNSAIDDIHCVESDKRDALLKESEGKIEELEGRVAQLRESLANRDTDLEAKLADAVTQYNDIKKSEELARGEMETMGRSNTDEIEKIRAECKAEEDKLNEILTSYKEQIRQHSVTIVAMETKMQKVTKKHKDAQTHVAELKKTIQELKNKPDPKPIVQVQKIPIKSAHEIAAMEQAILTFRQENVELKQRLAGQQEVVISLRRDLDGATARISDVTGELSEKQKMEMEANQDMVKKREKELTELRQKMVKLSELVDKQKAEIIVLSNELSQEKSLHNKLKNEAEDRVAKIQILEERVEVGREEQKKQLDIIESEGKITEELTALGAQCRGERHEKVIARQREALAELRARIKSLECTNPPLPSQDQALQQVMSLKKELSDMRASQAITDDNKNRQSGSPLDRQVDKVRGMSTAFDPDLDMEKSAHRDTLEALEHSETSYLSLLRAMTASLDMSDVHGLRSMANIPRDERTRLHREREESCELIASRIKLLKDRVSRKDDLLQGYETDLVKMRKAQNIAQKKSSDVENLTDDVRRSIEEAQYLRETLKRTKELLEKEKRLNSAIKQKKTFHLENERSHLAKTPKTHKCVQEDIFGKESARTKSQGELLKKREYEVKSLKQQLYDRERQIIEKERRLINMEASLFHDQEARLMRACTSLSMDALAAIQCMPRVAKALQTRDSTIQCQLLNEGS